ncbi:MAG: carboxymuconolactone decarboxylase family protein [Betaproteobacteria bacterium]|nr:carboxymuconolactone decarboxylase family protein [Betaproteobacteria bacterium]
MRLPAVDEQSNADLKEIFGTIAQTRGKVSDVLRGLGHAPDGLRAFAAYGEYVRYRTTLSGRARELTILALARGNQYAWTHHAPVALKEGVTQAELDELNQGQLAKSLSGAERAAIQYAREFAQGGNVSDATFASAREKFGDRGITDITLLCGYFIALAAVINALHIDLEADRAPMMKPVG